MGILSSSPKVYALEKTVIIEKSDGIRQLWGNEASLYEAIRVAEIIQFELRVMYYVLEHIDDPEETIYASLRNVASDVLISEMITEATYQKKRKKHLGSTSKP